MAKQLNLFRGAKLPDVSKPDLASASVGDAVGESVEEFDLSAADLAPLLNKANQLFGGKARAFSVVIDDEGKAKLGVRGLKLYPASQLLDLAEQGKLQGVIGRVVDV